MRQVTIALIQSIFALLAVITNSILQGLSLVRLNKAVSSVPNMQQTKQLVLWSMVAQAIASLILLVLIIILLANRDETRLNVLVYIALFVSGFLLVGGGVIGAMVSSRLQCYKSGDDDIQAAWQFNVIVATIGFVSAIFMLAVQAFVRRTALKEAALKRLTRKHVTVEYPTYQQLTEKQQLEHIRREQEKALRGRQKEYATRKRGTYHPQPTAPSYYE